MNGYRPSGSLFLQLIRWSAGLLFARSLARPLSSAWPVDLVNRASKVDDPSLPSLWTCFSPIVFVSLVLPQSPVSALIARVVYVWKLWLMLLLLQLERCCRLEIVVAVVVVCELYLLRRNVTSM